MDLCIYVLRSGQTSTLIIAIYVDDILLTGPNVKTIERFERLLAQKFKMTHGGNVSFILGIRMTTKSEGRILNQEHFAKALLGKFNMTNAKRFAIPLQAEALEVLTMVTPQDEKKEGCVKKYSEAIGSLMPDLAFPVSLSQFTASPSAKHWEVVKRTLRY
ncbi:MAG: reverse transcriptase (RNA-dependent DNA polymerase)-domain-containing protein [Olpidium bornovanus]|uniref:Reverse transcriptase (RNA-dependent DNA polymerase)-domain-containing protein n=1 Tax=Olpidium bornovanus TaxID=278681 RepID=A0A8H7ZY72_9FUNG|nr:MAG: reverse transcriptase (RNA-dependent DNA polymerase)-domain-containing protein [Olpidium bornovanus]